MRPLFRFKRFALRAIAGLLAFFLGAGSQAAADRLSFKIEIQDQAVDLPILFAPVLPGELLEVGLQERPEKRSLVFDLPDAGEAITDGFSLSWKAPEEPGLYPISLRETASGETMLINVFVMVPASEMEDGVLNDYRIGEYPAEPLRGLDSYRAPLGFIEVNDQTSNVRISPRFTLGQFVCKQVTTADQRYVVLRPPLLVKLETALDLLEEEGISAESLFIMSGYRTPFYNKAIGNVPNSRHVYGDAADVYVDVRPRDGDMDDLNGDGRVTKADANFFYDLVHEFDGSKVGVRAQGGLGSYDRNAAHGPFLHIDTRGYAARWGR